MNGFLKFCATVGTGIVTLVGYIVSLAALVLIGAVITSIATQQYH